MYNIGMPKEVNKYSLGIWLVVLLLLTTFILNFSQRLDGNRGSSIKAEENSTFIIGSCPGSGQNIFGFGNRSIGSSTPAETGCFDGRGVRKGNVLTFDDCQRLVCSQ